jgi:hypothetical protein
MPVKHYLKQHTAVISIPNELVNDKNKIVKSLGKQGNLLTKSVIITGNDGNKIKILDKGVRNIEPKPAKAPKPAKKPKPAKEPEIYKIFGETFPIIIKPLTEKELKKDFNFEMYGYIDSIEKFNKLNFTEKNYIELDIHKNDDMINEASREFVNENYGYHSVSDEDKFDRAVDKYTDKFYKIIKKLRKKSKIEFLKYIDQFNMVNVKEYRFIF